MELGALVVLLIPEARTPGGASVWSWYWPLANTLYFVGLIAAGIAIIWTVPALTDAIRRSDAVDRSLSMTALALAVLAIVINRLAPYH